MAPARMWERNRGRDLGGGVVGWTAAIAGWDFIYYWNHRFMHEVRALWAIHVVHHSSERYNLSTALRQPVADVFGVFVPYGVLAAARGAPRAHRAGPRHQPALPVLDPHRHDPHARRGRGGAQHAVAPPGAPRQSTAKYIDRNHGSILIVWDRLFGTFEREEEPVVYGLTKNIETYNPVTDRHPRVPRHRPRRRRGPTTGRTGCRSCSAARAGRTHRHAEHMAHAAS